MAKQPETTLEDVLNQFSFEEIKAAHEAKQQKDLQPRKDKVMANFADMQKEIDAIRKLDPKFALPWKSSGKKTPSGRVLQDADLKTAQDLVQGEPKQLKEIAGVLKVHHFTLKKFLKGKHGFKIATKNNKAMLSYTP